jgi:hypothetical protein
VANGFTVTDRRGSARRADPESSIIIARGSAEVQRALALGAQGSAPSNPEELRHAAQVRTANQRLTSSMGSGGGSSYQFATQRPLDPMFYWRESGMPYDVDDEEVLKQLREWCRFIYRSDPVLASCIDIYSKYPVLGAEFTCKNEKLTEFYTDLMFEELNYEDYLIDIGREYWTVGEAWPLGYFDELLGIWESDELVPPDDISVEKSPFLKDPRFFMTLPESIRKTLVNKKPLWEYEALIKAYPEMQDYVSGSKDKKMPVSGSVLKQIKFTGDTFNPRGLPILLRALRPCIQEEMLNAAQDAIASRFYTPLIHAQIGASATDLGTERPWVPDRADIQNFLGDMDAALAADFRVLATHFAVNLTSVFGRENMPNLDNDFERLTERKLQVFGLSGAMLNGSGQGETYAADALNRDLVSQLLTTYQRRLKRLMHDRMLMVAEAQHHYDYEERGGKRYQINQEVLIVTEDGERIIEEQPKLLVPDIQMASMSMRSEDSRASFVEALRASGVPISMQTRMKSMSQSGLNLKDEIDLSRDEQVRLAVEEQRTRQAKYMALKAENLPIPEDLREDFDPKIVNKDEVDAANAAAAAEQAAQHSADAAGAQMMGPGEQIGAPTRTPQLGVDDPTTPNLAPTDQELGQPAGQPLGGPLGPGGDSVPPGGQLIQLPRNKSRPDESDEQRADMPKAGTKNESTLSFLEAPAHVRQGRRAVLPSVEIEYEPEDTEAEGGR